MSQLVSKRSALVAAVAGVACLSAIGQVHAAGLFDFLFGAAPPRQQQPAPDFVYSPPPLEMRVRPRKQRDAVRETKPKLVTPIDPVKNPQWYLDDPTLRRGDIVVLKDRVLVFQGGPGGSLSDFASLDRSNLSATERTKISQMAGLKRVTKTTTAEAEIVKPRSSRKTRSAKRSRTVKAAPSTATAMTVVD